MDRRLFLKGIPLWSTALNLPRAPLLAETFGKPTPEAIPPGRNLLPPSVPPEVVLWGWAEKPEFEPEGYRQFIDLIAEHTNYGMIATTLRAPRHEITDPETHSQIKRAAEYAHRRSLKIAMDLDVRLARSDFRRRFPDQQQWMLRIRAFPFAPSGPTQASIASQVLSDHMTWPEAQYDRLSGRLLGVYRSAPNQPGMAPESIKDRCRALEESPERVTVAAPDEARAAGGELVVAAAFEYRTPDVFSPQLLDFQREICQQYRDAGLDGGIGADEWGFPPVFNHGGKDGDFWYSAALAEQYRKAGGGDFLLDGILMALGWGGTYEQRLVAINRYMQLILARNTELEQGFYRHAKEAFGPESFTATHATWGVMPWGDAFKDGYDWWGATRDYGQTDEHWPIPVRTALAKKMGGSIWYNQFYAPAPEPYARELWQDARAGGRVNLHPLWPSSLGRKAYKAYREIFSSPFMRAESRVRLLNLIQPAALDCPVAIVFGHAASLNWEGPHFGDLGEGFAAELWEVHGVRADIIPSSEIASGALKLGGDGRLTYGVQRYRAMVFLNPDFEGPETFDFLRRVAQSPTQVFVQDETHRVPDGSVRSKQEVIPGAGLNPTPAVVAEFLQSWSSPRHPSPPDLVRLIDGTRLLLRGEKDPAGDRIDEAFFVDCRGGMAQVSAGATGVFGIRLDPSGDLQALAASELRYLRIELIEPFGEPTPKLNLEIRQPVDLALWQDAHAKWHGVIQGDGEIPQEFLSWTKDWTRLDLTPAITTQ
jgi:hypothetical protein